MLFNSIEFALFLPIVFLIYWSFSNRLKIQNLFVVVVSYVFYGWWDWRFLLLIALTTICSYYSGIGIVKTHSRKLQRTIMWSNIIFNIGILGLFKYYNFFINNLKILLNPLGIQLDSITLNLILPVGISFYTFQALSYSIDVYRNKIKPTEDIVAFFAFISFFPQLVAGPIERATNLLPQFLARRQFHYDQAVEGCRQILWGFFKKMVVADNCAVIVNKVFSDWESMGGINLWIGAVAFSFQIYGDFSGYSDIAIGVARLFGIKLMRNFNVPYFSRDIAEFWRRWHISLTTWFRDYIYIPLGGSRCSKKKVFRNTMIIFLVSGLWHGAEWTFIIWGGYHAILFAPLILLGRNRKYTTVVADKSILPTMSESILMGVTFLLVAIGWVLFRADTLPQALGYITRMFTNFHYTTFHLNKNSLIGIIGIMVLLVVEWVERKREHEFAIAGHGLLRYAPIRYTLYYSIVMIILFCSKQEGDFIYFQF